MAWIVNCGGKPTDGEKRLADTLVKDLPEGYGILTNFRIEGRGNPLEIDAVVLAPHAIYVIENKDWHGEITADSAMWRVDGKERENVMHKIEHKAVVLKSALTSYYSGFKDIYVQSCVSLSADPEPDTLGLIIPRKGFVFLLKNIAAFLRDPKRLEENWHDTRMPGEYHAMLRRAFLKGLFSPKGNIEIHRDSPSESYRVERIAYPHNRYLPYLVDRENEKIILKCYDLPAELKSSELEGFVREHHKVIERYPFVLSRLQDTPDDDGAHCIEIGESSFVDTRNRLYVVPTRWQSGGWKMLTAIRSDMDLGSKLETALRICQGLDFAHRQGIVHRNFSTDCIQVTGSGEVRIIDWDFAIFWDDANRRQVAGTTYLPQHGPEQMQGDLKRYMRFQAPELKDPAKPDQQACPETDLYSLGIVLYELFSNREFNADPERARLVLGEMGLMEAIVNNILALCEQEPEKRNREILPALVDLFGKQSEHKYLPRIKPGYQWKLGVDKFTNARNRHETRMSVSYRMDQLEPKKRFVIVKFLKAESPSEAGDEQVDVRRLLGKLDPRYTTSWIADGRVGVDEAGYFVWDATAENTRQRYYQIFEYIEGERLDQAITHNEFAEPLIALRLSIHLLRAVQAVHAAGWVHYDIKPDNFILPVGWRKMLDDPAQPQAVKIIDFGSAYPLDRAAPRRSLSPGFKTADAYDVKDAERYRTDLNSAALVIVSMLCGLNAAPSYSPNLDLDLLKQKTSERVFSLLENMTRPKRLEWRYKNVAQFAAELEQALQEQKVETVTLTRLQKHAELRKKLDSCYGKVLHPIEERTPKPEEDSQKAEPSKESPQKMGFDKVDPESVYFNHIAQDALKDAQRYINALIHLKNELIDQENIILGFDKAELDREWKLVDMKRRLAWAIDRLGESDELTRAMEDARNYRAKEGETSDSQVAYLLAQATRRREQLAEDHRLIVSTTTKNTHLKDLVSKLSEMNIPSGEFKEIHATFLAIIEKTQTFERLGIKNVLSEVQDKQEKLTTTVEQLKTTDIESWENIGSSALSAILEFEKKARENLAVFPLTARQWYETVGWFRVFLDKTEHAEKLNNLDELNRQIEKNCIRWEAAQAHLDQAAKLREETHEEEKEYWEACEQITQAFAEYPNHAEIGSVLQTSVAKITEMIRSEISRAKSSREEELPLIEAGLISADWQEGRLVRFEIPSWLAEARRQIQQQTRRAEGLTGEFQKVFGSDLYARTEQVISAEIRKVLDPCRQHLHWMDEQIVKRQEIRTLIKAIQEQVDTHQVSLAQDMYDEFLRQHPQLVNDIELKQAAQGIAGHLEDPELVRRARLAFANRDWQTCIEYCDKVKSRDRRVVTLQENVNAEYSAKYLYEVSDDIPDAQFVSVMKQLARVYQACTKLETIWLRQDYIEAGPWLEQVQTNGVGYSPLVEAEKSRISIEDKRDEYVRRTTFGNETFAGQFTLAEWAERYDVDGEELRAAPLPTETWIRRAGNLLEGLLAFDPTRETLWVGKRKVWQDELASAFLKQLAGWIAILQRAPSNTDDQLELALSSLKTSHRVGRLYNLDIQQRRWVVLHYHAMKESQFGGDYEKIVRSWREAVHILSDDSVIAERFKGSRYQGWIAMLDAALEQAAMSRSYQEFLGHDQALQNLLRQDVSAAPHLFAPIMDADSREIVIPCNETREIDFRRQLGKDMYKAEDDLARNPIVLPLVMRDLKKAVTEPGKTILAKKADAVASRFVADTIREGDSHSVDPDPSKRLFAAKFYIQAFQLSPDSTECRELIQNNARLVEKYWNWLKQQIEELDVRDATIHDQSWRANELDIELSGVEQIQQVANFQEVDVRETRNGRNGRPGLDAKRNTLEVGKRLLDDYFSPRSKEWQNAINPDGRQDDNDSGWNRLKRHMGKLVKDFGDGHVQIKKIELDLEKFSRAVKDLHAHRETIIRLLDTNEDDMLGELLEVCLEINNAADKLAMWEPEHHAQWKGWDGQATYPSHYPDKFTGFSKWKFEYKGAGQPQEFPYWQDSERFKNWQAWLGEFIRPQRGASSSGQEPEFEFLQEEWNEFWKIHPDVEAHLRSDYEAQRLFLGSFLMLAFKASGDWLERVSKAQRKAENYDKLYQGLNIQNKTWLTREYQRVSHACLDTWIAKLDEQEKELCLTRQSNDKRNQIRKIRREAMYMSESLRDEIDVLNRVESELLSEFDRQFNYANPRGVGATDAEIQLMNDLCNFTNKEPFSVDVLQCARNLKITFTEVDRRYVSEVAPQHTFYAHGLESANRGMG